MAQQQPLMPKATAAWLVENTVLTFKQIAEFCGLHELEVQAIADGDGARIQPMDPIANGQLSQEEIDRCSKDAKASLKLLKSDLPQPRSKTKGPRYTPVSKRQDKPDGIAWLIKNHPELTDAQIGRLLGTTKTTIAAIRDRSHWNIQNIKAQHPVRLGLCKQRDLDQAVTKAQRSQTRAEKAAS